MTQPLCNLPTGTHGTVQQINGEHRFALRAAALGFTVGTEVLVIHNYGRGPVMIGVRGARLALGRGEAFQIQVETE